MLLLLLRAVCAGFPLVHQLRGAEIIAGKILCMQG